MNEFNKTTKSDKFMIDPRNIVVIEGFNSRTNFDIDTLAKQIKGVGAVLNPVSVVPFKDENGNDKYKLVDGERRYRACMKLLEEGFDLPRIPALFISKSKSEEELIIEQIMRNEGKAFTEYEYGVAYHKLIEKGYTIADIAKKFGKNAGCVQYALENLERDERVQAVLRDDKIAGSEVRRIYQTYGGETEEAIKAVLTACEVANVTGAKKATIGLVNKAASGKIKADISDDGLLSQIKKISDKSVSAKDTKKIREGFRIFLNYLSSITKNGEIELDIDIIDIYEWMNENKESSISDFFDEKLSEMKAAS